MMNGDKWPTPAQRRAMAGDMKRFQTYCEQHGLVIHRMTLGEDAYRELVDALYPDKEDSTMSDIKDNDIIQVDYESGATLTGPAVIREDGSMMIRLTDGYAVMFVRDHDGRPAHGVTGWRKAASGSVHWVPEETIEDPDDVNGPAARIDPDSAFDCNGCGYPMMDSWFHVDRNRITPDFAYCPSCGSPTITWEDPEVKA